MDPGVDEVVGVVGWLLSLLRPPPRRSLVAHLLLTNGKAHRIQATRPQLQPGTALGVGILAACERLLEHLACLGVEPRALLLQVPLEGMLLSLVQVGGAVDDEPIADTVDLRFLLAGMVGRSLAPLGHATDVLPLAVGERLELCRRARAERFGQARKQAKAGGVCLGQVGLGDERTVGHIGDRGEALGGEQKLDLVNHRAVQLLVRTVAWFDPAPKRHAFGVGEHVQHDLLQVGAVVLGVAEGDKGFGLFALVVAEE